MNKRIYLSFSGLCLIFMAQAVFAQTPSLEPGTSLQKEIGREQSHTYRIALHAGQFMHVVAQQKGIDVSLILKGPDGSEIAKSSFTRAAGKEMLSAEASAGGDYTLTVETAKANAPHGSYALTVETRSAATAQDKQRIAAERLMTDGFEILDKKEQADVAVPKFEQATAIWRELNDKELTALAILKTGSCYIDLSKYENAVVAIKESLAIYQELKYSPGEASATNDLAGTYYRTGNFEEAAKNFERAVTIAREINDPVTVALATNNVGAAYASMGSFEKALEYHEKALKMSRDLSDIDTESRALNSLGVAARRLGQTDKALGYYEQVLVLDRGRGYRRGEAIAFANMSGVYANMGDYAKATEMLEKGLVIFRELKSKAHEGVVLANLSYFNLNLKRYDKAIEFSEQALAISRETKNLSGQIPALHNMGDSKFHLGRHAEAIANLREALKIAREIKSRDDVSILLYSLARAQMGAGDLNAADKSITEDLRISESVRAEFLNPRTRADFFSAIQDSYQLYTELLMRRHKAEPTKGFDAMAVEVSERRRARSLIDQLSESKIDLKKGIDATLIENERAIAKQLNDKATALAETEKKEDAAALEKDISRLETDLERAQAAIRKASPQYADLTQTNPLGFKEIQALLDDDTLLLEYSLGEERSFLWVIGKDSLTSYDLPGDEKIEESARGLYDLLTVRNARVKGETTVQRAARIKNADAKLPVAAAELSDMLIAPAVAKIANKRLVIVAEGALQYIPFAMLPDPRKKVNTAAINGRQPLVVTNEIVSLPSASALAVQRTELGNRKPAAKTLAVIADPVFDKTDARFKVTQTTPVAEEKTADERGLEYIADANASGKLVIRRLPFTAQEASGLMLLAPKDSSFSAIGFKANRETVMSGELANYRYVHFATHGLLDTERPGLSALVLSTVGADGKPANGFLRANDIYNMKLPAELVVLSACQTGLGEEVKGEGLIGLTRGFMYAGARRVTVSLWSVNDRATSELMQKFYRAMLKQNESPSAALRSAQVEMWKHKGWQSPYYWGAFVMQGDWR